MNIAGEQIDLINTERTHPIIYNLISNGFATYREIRDEYSFEEVIDLYEMSVVKAYNKNKILENNYGQVYKNNRR